MDLAQARRALDRGADVIIAQGAEAGGHSGWVSTMVLVPQIVDIAGDVPVVAAGGIADGRGMAAALALGAQGVAMGTRFLASEEMGIHGDWKRMIVRADATDAVKSAVADHPLPPFNRQHDASLPSVLRSSLLDELAADPARVSAEAPALGRRFLEAIRAGGGHEYLAFAGQSTGLVHDVRPAAAIVLDTVAEAGRILARLGTAAAHATV
jgi:enoyl-[acyl-carrier protein] reductase II